MVAHQDYGCPHQLAEVMLWSYVHTQSQEKIQSGYMDRFHIILGIWQQWRTIDRGSHLLRRQIFQNVFEELQAGDGIEIILAFLENNILMAIATAERFRYWIYSCCSGNTGESFRKLFKPNLQEKIQNTEAVAPRRSSVK